MNIHHFRNTFSFCSSALYALLILWFTSCQAEMDNPGLSDPVAPLSPNTSILELKRLFENRTMEIPLRQQGTPYVIRGRIISSDAAGNIYKTIVIQDRTAAISFAINQWDLFNSWRLGQEMVVNVTGLFIGYYGGLQQIGYPDKPYRDTPQLTFMAYDYWLAHAFPNGLPDPYCSDVKFLSEYPDRDAYCIVLDDFLPLQSASLSLLQSQLVEFRNVTFLINEGENSFAPYHEYANRTLIDQAGRRLTLRNSGYSSFYDEPLPEGLVNVRGILSYFNRSWQLIIRNLDDITPVSAD